MASTRRWLSVIATQNQALPFREVPSPPIRRADREPAQKEGDGLGNRLPCSYVRPALPHGAIVFSLDSASVIFLRSGQTQLGRAGVNLQKHHSRAELHHGRPTQSSKLPQGNVGSDHQELDRSSHWTVRWRLACVAGVGKLVVVDGDFAEDFNSNRTVGLTYAEAHQVNVISARVAAVSPESEIVNRDGSWNLALYDLKKVDYIFGCVDTMGARDELERFARRYRIPYIDIGMEVHGEEGRYFIGAQVIASLPGQPCMRCMGYIADAPLAAENARYGAVGRRPQVVWPNGVLASTAVGIFMTLLTPWNDTMPPPIYVVYDGNRCTIGPSPKLSYLSPASVATWMEPRVRAISSKGDCFAVSR